MYEIAVSNIAYMIELNTLHISKICNAQHIGEALLVLDISTDSRMVHPSANTLFIALKGPNHNGHMFIREMYEKGIRAFLVSEAPTAENILPDAVFIVSTDTLISLQLIATYVRKRFQYPVVAITGSNGKTIVKEWIYQLLWNKIHILRSPGSYNSQVGVPVSVLRMNETYELALFEAGISQCGEMERLEKILLPEIGIFTSLGNAHLENFQSQTQLAQEKLTLFTNCNTIIYSTDNALLYNTMQETFGHSEKKLITWSSSDENAFVFLKSTTELNGITQLHISCQNKNFEISVPFTGRWAVENAMVTATFLLYFKSGQYFDAQLFQNLMPVAMRMELKPAINQSILLNDSYNSDIHSVQTALKLLQTQNGYKHKTVVLSDILQSTHNKTEMYTYLADLLKTVGIDRFIGIGEELQTHAALFHSIPETYFATETKAALKIIQNLNFEQDAILIKGARKYALERIVELLEEKKNGTRLEISMAALIHNLNIYRSKLKKNVKTMVMVKALSYGSGLAAIARMLEYQRINYLGVALADEGMELRKAGIHIPIIVMNPSDDAFDHIVQHKLEPALYDCRKLVAFALYLRKMNIETYPIHIKIDTGMNRLGFKPDEIHCLFRELKNFPQLKVQSAFSHLVASEDPEMDFFTQEQISVFTDISNQLRAQLSYDFIRHILNSAGIERFPDAQFEMVRLGIGLYGVSTHIASQLKPISQLRTVISQIKTITPDQTVGYNRKGVVHRQSRIAVVPIGYADGLNRKLGNGNWRMMVNNNLVPTLGNICMDMTMLDVTDTDAQVGDEVIVFGISPSVYQMSQTLQTIPYEILTGISGRVKRIYLQED